MHFNFRNHNGVFVVSSAVVTETITGIHSAYPLRGGNADLGFVVSMNTRMVHLPNVTNPITCLAECRLILVMCRLNRNQSVVITVKIFK